MDLQPNFSFYMYNMKRAGVLDDKYVRNLVSRDLEIVERALEHYNKKGSLPLEILIPEYNNLINSNYSYTVVYSRGRHAPLLEDLVNKLPEFDTLLISIHRRLSLDLFRESYFMDPEDLVNLFKTYGEEGTFYPILMAPPWSLSKPRFIKDLVIKLENIYGYPPPSPWTRITEFFSQLYRFVWEERQASYGGKIAEIATYDRMRVRILEKRFSRIENELIEILSTKCSQMELFGLTPILEKLIFPLSRRLTNFELLYTLITIYHKYLVSSLVDYAGGIVTFAPDQIAPKKIGITSETLALALSPLLVRMRPLSNSLMYYGYAKISGRSDTLKLLKNLFFKLRDLEESIEVRRMFYMLGQAAKKDISSARIIGERFSEIFQNYLEEKVAMIERKLKIIDMFASVGITSLTQKISELIPTQGLDSILHILLSIIIDMVSDKIIETVRQTYREALIHYIEKHPLHILQGHGIVWLAWAQKSKTSSKVFDIPF